MCGRYGIVGKEVQKVSPSSDAGGCVSSLLVSRFLLDAVLPCFLVVLGRFGSPEPNSSQATGRTGTRGAKTSKVVENRRFLEDFVGNTLAFRDGRDLLFGGQIACGRYGIAGKVVQKVSPSSDSEGCVSSLLVSRFLLDAVLPCFWVFLGSFGVRI